MLDPVACAVVCWTDDAAPPAEEAMLEVEATTGVRDAAAEDCVELTAGGTMEVAGGADTEKVVWINAGAVDRVELENATGGGTAELLAWLTVVTTEEICAAVETEDIDEVTRADVAALCSAEVCEVNKLLVVAGGKEGVEDGGAAATAELDTWLVVDGVSELNSGALEEVCILLDDAVN